MIDKEKLEIEGQSVEKSRDLLYTQFIEALIGNKIDDESYFDSTWLSYCSNSKY